MQQQHHHQQKQQLRQRQEKTKRDPVEKKSVDDDDVGACDDDADEDDPNALVYTNSSSEVCITDPVQILQTLAIVILLNPSARRVVNFSPSFKAGRVTGSAAFFRHFYFLPLFFLSTLSPTDRLVGRVVKASTSRAEDPGFDSRLRRGDFSGSSHTSDLKIGTPVAFLPGAWGYRVSSGSGRPGVRIL